MPAAPRDRIGVAACAVALIALTAWLAGPLLGCASDCFVDYAAVRGNALAAVEAADARLNAWILAWDQHAFATRPSALFDANIYYPARNALAASEHLLGVAALLLPLRWLDANAVLLHQAALVGSSLLLAFTSAALVRWLTGSCFAAFLGGAMALCMPWRWTELSHIQLLNAQWFPLVWLWIGRIVYRDAPRGAALWLGLVLGLQVLSSFYLAYFLFVSCAVLVPLLWWRTGVDRTATWTLVRAASVPTALIGAIALPYLAWQRTSGFVPLTGLFDSVTLPEAWSVLAPDLALGFGTELPLPVVYALPLGVCALAALTLLPVREGERWPRWRGFAVALWGVCGVCAVLVLGRELRVGELALPLPGQWLAWIVPGFENLRSPLRWAIVIGIAFPILAGVGAWRLERYAAGLAAARGASETLGGVGARGLAAVLLAATLPATPIPARPAWEGAEASLAAWSALAALPAGPVIELPWPLAETRNVDLASRYMLGSTAHWKPLVNGTSGYYPRTFALLAEVARRLPDPAALRQLQGLVDVRWVVLHGPELTPRARAEWSRAVADGRFERRYARGGVQILEIPGAERAGTWMPALLSGEPRARTFAGLPRTPLVLPARAGRVEAREPGSFHVRGGNRLPQLVRLRLVNASDVPWPGFDADPEGLVRVRYTFESDGEVVLTETAPLIVDVAPRRAVATSAVVRPPAQSGRYTLRLDLVQESGGVARPLPVKPAELDVSVEELAPLSKPR